MIEHMLGKMVGQTGGAGGPVLAFGLPGGQEWIILLVLGLLIFGRRLPEVGRSLGRGIVEFKKGIRGIEDEIEESSSTPANLPKTAPPASLSEPTEVQSTEAQSTQAQPTQAQPTQAQPTHAEPPAVKQSAVGNEGANPYAPKEAPAKDE